MSDYSSPLFTEGTVRPAQDDLSAEQIETVINEFRSWLEETGTTAQDQQTYPAEDASEPAAPPDLHTLLGQFTALRHEIKLQTKAGRGLMEQNSEALEHLGKALNTLEKSQATISAQRGFADEEFQRRFLKALIELHDALTLADREVARVKEKLAPVLEELVEEAEELVQFRERQNRLPFWKRLFGRRKPEPEPDDVPAIAKTSAFRVRQFVTSLVTGYSMSVQRLERALAENNLKPIVAMGKSFDPERMEAIEVKLEPGRESTEVIEEVRRGYLWGEQVLRPAQVRVAKPV